MSLSSFATVGQMASAVSRVTREVLLFYRTLKEVVASEKVSTAAAALFNTRNKTRIYHCVLFLSFEAAARYTAVTCHDTRLPACGKTTQSTVRVSEVRSRIQPKPRQILA